MKRICQHISEKLKVNDENVVSNGKIDKALELVKDKFNKTFSNTNIKFLIGNYTIVVTISIYSKKVKCLKTLLNGTNINYEELKR